MQEMRNLELDRFDYQILEALQDDARATHQKLAQTVALSASQIGRRIAAAIHDLPEVLDCYTAAGEADYFLRIVVPDLPSLSRFVMNKLMCLPLVRSVKSTITLEAIKHSTRLPLALPER
jgi:DNA-binding Lrp family transcriptional regulator